MTARATPFLTFQPSRGQNAAEAIAFYTSLFHDGEVVSVRRRQLASTT